MVLFLLDQLRGKVDRRDDVIDRQPVFARYFVSRHTLSKLTKDGHDRYTSALDDRPPVQNSGSMLMRGFMASIVTPP